MNRVRRMREGKKMDLAAAVIVDLVLCAVIVATTAYYVHKGFLAGMIDLAANLVSMGLAWTISGKVSPTVFENFFKSNLIDKMAHNIQQQGGVNLNNILGSLSGFLPQRLLDDIAASAGGLLGSGAPNVAQQVVEHVIAPLVIPLITVVVFFATFALCRVAAALLVTAFKNVNRIPLIGGANRLLGGVVGVAAGVLYVLLALCLIWAVVVITNGTLPVLNNETLAGSRFYSFFSAYNPFL